MKTQNEIIDFLETTTEDGWCTDVVRNKNGQNCLFGHLHLLGGGELWDYFEARYATTYMVYPVNDGENPDYQQGTPKQRCIAYVKDLFSGKAKTTVDLINEYDDFLNS